ALTALRIRYQVEPGDLSRIPATGPLIVVANHPMGAADGLVLAALLRQVRPDIKLLANHLLARIPELRELLFMVDPFGGPAALSRSIAGTRSAMRWVQEGHVLCIFPAGEVSHLRLRQRCITDPPWNSSIARIIQRTKAAVLPVFFEGANSRLF